MCRQGSVLNMHIFQPAIFIVRKWEHWKPNLLKMLKWPLNEWSLPDSSGLNSAVTPDVCAARWTSVVTAKGRGYGQYQVPHQNCDWNHKTVTDWARPWPVLTCLAWAGQNSSPGVRLRHPRRADPTGTFSSSLAETRPSCISFGHPPVTHFCLTLHISPPIWPNFPMSRMF